MPLWRKFSRIISKSSRARGSKISATRRCGMSRDGRSPTDGTSTSLPSGMRVTIALPYIFLIFSASARGVQRPTDKSLVK